MSNRLAQRRKARAVAQTARVDVYMRDAAIVLLGLIIILVIGKSGGMV